MDEDRSAEKILSQKKSSIDDIIDHITADLQSYDGKYILLGQPSNNETQSIWQQRVTRQPESLNYVQSPYQQEQQQQRVNSLDSSNVYYPSNSFVESGRSNYLPYVFNNAPTQYQNSAPESHYNYIYYQQNANHPTPDYGLFNASTNYPNPHLIENLVGNWVPNQNGTYSPFGGTSHVLDGCNDSIKMHHPAQQVQHGNSSSTFSKLGNSAVRRPRMVAEVRPMRPTYSDVLAKSVTQTVSPTNGAAAKTVTSSKVDAARVKTVKKKGNNVTKNGGAVLKRQHSSGSEEQMMNGVKSGNDKKTSPPNENHGWSSVEDLSKLSSYGEFEKECQTDRSPLSNLNNKKTNRKTKSVRQNGLTNDACNNKKANSAQPENRKTAKKSQATSNSNLQWGVGKQTSPVRNEKKSSKTVPSAEVKKSVSASKSANQNVDSVGDVSKSIATSKLNPRFANAPTNHRKTQRSTKRREGSSKIALIWKRWREKTSQYVMFFFTWLLYLLWDVLVMSFHLCFYLLGVIISCSGAWFNTIKSLLKNLCTNPRNWWHQRKKFSKTSSSKKPYSNRSDNSPANLTSNISLPQTGEEAMKRLFACKGKDPYSILGVTKNCPDEVIKKYYKKQAVLVHPDKNNQPGAEEAFKILVHAFELIGEPERRKAYDRCVMESMEEEWEELSNLLSQLHKKMEYAANTIRCTNCGSRHKRSMVERPLYAARFCSQCKIHHSAREGDIWAESSMLGWLWRYYACMDGAVYDISEWAACQADNLRHLKPNTHVVQYRIVVGKHRPNPPPPTSPQPPPPPPPNCSEQDIEDFLSSLYGHGGGGQSGGDQNGSRFRKKSKRKK